MKRARAESSAESSPKLLKLEAREGRAPPDLPAEGDQKCVVYIVDKKIPSAQLSHLKSVAQKKDFTLATSINASVTHIVTALPSYERLVAAIATLPTSAAVEVVTLEWLTTSFVEGSPTQVTDRYRLKKAFQPAEAQEVTPKPTTTSFQLPDYECQRPTPLSHHNHLLTDALELMERHYLHVDYKQGDTRALAFRQASCVLKALPRKVEYVREVSGLHRIGQHSLQIIADILKNGFSSEVRECQKSEWFQCMELFSAVYGCGSATANKWYNKGLRTIDDIKNCAELEFTELQKYGLQYHDHISVPVSREETDVVTRFILNQSQLCCPGTSVAAVGGYRRGKSHSHDIDLLLTHTDPEVVEVLLNTLLEHLQAQGVVLHSDVSIGHNTLAQVRHQHSNTATHNYTQGGKKRRVKFDHLDKALCILQLKASLQTQIKGSAHHQKKATQSSSDDGPLIRRVDLIVAPPHQYPFALVSWTGSKQFNRSLRRYSVKECNMSVTAHGIYDIAEGKFIEAKSEEEMFSILNLDYLPPSLRNC